MGSIRNAKQIVINSACRHARSILNCPSNNIIVACMPKSGSTYLSRLLMEVTRFKNTQLNKPAFFLDQTLSKHLLRQKIGGPRGSVSHIHLRGTPANLKLISSFGLKPIVLTRNIFDIVPSIADHWKKEPNQSMGDFPMEKCLSMDQASLHDFIIYNCLPWYFRFLFSWHAASEQINTYWLTYEQFFSDQHKYLCEILEFCGLAYPDQDIDHAVHAMGGQWTRRNKGVSGRGDELLLPHQKDAIRQLASVWKAAPAKLECIGIT